MNIRLRIFLLLFCFFLVVPTVTRAQGSQTFEQSLVTLTNQDRLEAGVLPLTESTLLSTAAQEKADDMVKEGYFAHTSPLGISPWHWITAVGYHYTHAGENLAMHFDDPTGLEAAWMASPLHRTNIVRNVYAQVGFGVASGIYQGQQTTFVVELFATPASKTL